MNFVKRNGLVQRTHRIYSRGVLVMIVPSFQQPQAIYRFESKRSDNEYLKQDLEKIGQDFWEVIGDKDDKY